MNDSEMRELQVLWVFTNGQGGIEPGSFFKKLIEAVILADLNNRSLLSLGFPEVVGAVRAYQTGVGIEFYPKIQKYIVDQKE